MPIIRSSTKMPSPPNMRRMAMGPKNWKRSSKRFESRFTALFSLGRRDLDRLAAAAGRGLVRIVEDETRAQLFLHEIQLGADQEEDSLGIDEDLHAPVFHHFLEGLGLR